MKLSDVLCGEYESPKRYPFKLIKKGFDISKHIITSCETRELDKYFFDRRDGRFCGKTAISPTGEPYVKIMCECSSTGEAEAMLLYLLEQYERLSEGKKLYWRKPPYLMYDIRKDVWYGRTRLLYSNKKVLKGKI